MKAHPLASTNREYQTKKIENNGMIVSIEYSIDPYSSIPGFIKTL